MNQFSFISPTTAVPTNVQNFLQIFQGLTIYILTLRINSRCHDEASPFIDFYTRALLTPVVYESNDLENGEDWIPKFSSKESAIVSPSKFTHLNLQLLLPAITRTMDFEEEKLGYVRDLIHDCGRVANYYVIFAPKLMRDAEGAIEGFKKFKDISAPARFLFVWDMEEIDVLCVFCPYAENAQYLYPLETPSSIQRVHEIDQAINRNMLQTTVHMTGSYRTDGICSRSTNFLLQNPISCAIYEVIARTNATIDFKQSLHVSLDKWGDGYVSHIASGLHPGYALLLKSRQWKVPLEWAIAGEWTFAFSFVNVVETGSIGVSAIWSAFDMQMWLFVLGSALSMAALLTFAYRQIYASVVDNFQYSLALVFSLVIERFVERGGPRLNPTMLIVSFIFAWAQLSSVLINSYKGYLFSTLASKSLPDVPKDMEGLATTPLFMYSRTSATVADKKLSFFHYKTREILSQRDRNNDAVGDTIEMMSRRLKFCPLGQDEVIILQAKSESSPTEMLKWDYSKENVKIPKNHIFVDTLAKVRTYTFALGLVSRPQDNRGFLFGEGLPWFLHRQPIFVQPNFFQPLFIHQMFGLVQSGIWVMWQRTSTSAEIFLTTKKMVISAENAGVKVKSARRILLQLINEDLSPPETEIIERPLTLEFMHGLLQMLGLGFFVALFLFIFEYVKRLAAGRRVRPVSTRSDCRAVETPEVEVSGEAVQKKNSGCSFHSDAVDSSILNSDSHLDSSVTNSDYHLDLPVLNSDSHLGSCFFNSDSQSGSSVLNSDSHLDPLD